VLVDVLKLFEGKGRLFVSRVVDANPPELGTVERAMKRVKRGRYVLMPAGPDTHGHFSHFYAMLWKPYLIEFLASLDPPRHAAAAE
jgi:hypothetical protein